MKIWLPQTIGVAEPRPGSCTFHLTLLVSLHVTGGLPVDETPFASGPRHCGQFCWSGDDAADREQVMEAERMATNGKRRIEDMVVMGISDTTELEGASEREAMPKINDRFGSQRDHAHNAFFAWFAIRRGAVRRFWSFFLPFSRQMMQSDLMECQCSHTPVVASMLSSRQI